MLGLEKQTLLLHTKRIAAVCFSQLVPFSLLYCAMVFSVSTVGHEFTSVSLIWSLYIILLMNVELRHLLSQLRIWFFNCISHYSCLVLKSSNNNQRVYVTLLDVTNRGVVLLRLCLVVKVVPSFKRICAHHCFEHVIGWFDSSIHN